MQTPYWSKKHAFRTILTAHIDGIPLQIAQLDIARAQKKIVEGK